VQLDIIHSDRFHTSNAVFIIRTIPGSAKTVDFHCRRTLSAGMAWASSFASLTAGSQGSCYSRRSRRLPFQSTR